MNYLPASSQVATNGTLSQSMLYPHTHHPSQHPYNSMQFLSHHSSQFAPAPVPTLIPTDYSLHPHSSQSLPGYTPPSKLTKLSNTPLIVEACQNSLSTQRPSDLVEHISTFLRRSNSIPNLSPGASEKIR